MYSLNWAKEHLLKHQMKDHRSKCKVDKITYSKSSSRMTYDVSKNKSLLHP